MLTLLNTKQACQLCVHFLLLGTYISRHPDCIKFTTMIKVIQFVDNGVTSALSLPCKIPDTSLAIESTSVLNQSFSNCFHKIIVLYKLGQNTPQVKPNNIRQIVHRKKLGVTDCQIGLLAGSFLEPLVLSPLVSIEYIADERVEQITNRGNLSNS